MDALFASDFETSRLFYGASSGRWRDRTVPARVGLERTGMGSALGDVDEDGELDWLVTAIYHPPLDPGNKLYLQRGEAFHEGSQEFGVVDSGWAWGAAFGDLNSDGHLDLVVASGLPGPTYPQHNDDPLRVYMREGPTFVDRAAELGVDVRGTSRGVALVDMDDDGDLDLLVSNNQTGLQLFRNDIPRRGNWLIVEGESTVSAPRGRGSHVYVSGEGLSRRVGLLDSTSHFLALAPPVAHFGLGQTEVVDVEVVFPSGARVVRRGVRANQTITVQEPASARMRPIPIPEDADCDDDGVIDACEEDCDANGFPDQCDVRDAPWRDCNENGALDDCEREAGFEVEACDVTVRLQPRASCAVSRGASPDRARDSLMLLAFALSVVLIRRRRVPR